MEKMDLKNLIDEYLSTQRLMSIATFAELPWIANVYYVHDHELNIYFVSRQWREHSKAIENNPNVAVAIADSHQPIYKPQKGLQIYGTAKKVNSLVKLKWMFQMWNKLIAGEDGEKFSDPKKFLDAGISAVYKIEPKRIKFFNTEQWKEEQFKVLDL